MITFAHIQPCRQISPFEVFVKELSSLLVVGRKSQFFFLQEKVKGYTELLGSGGGELDEGVNGWQMFTEAWLHFCDHKMVEGFYHHYHKSHFTPSPQWGTCGERSSLLWQKHWAPLSATFTLSRWPGCIAQGAPAKCGPPLPSSPSIFTPVCRGLLTASLSLQWDSTALRAGTGSSRVTSNLAQIVSELLF